MCTVAIQLAYVGSFRSSEIVYDPGADLYHKEHAFRTSDVVFLVGPRHQEVQYINAASVDLSQITAMRLVSRSTKNDRSGQGRETYFTAGILGPDTVNIVRVMYDWALRSRIRNDGILLSYWDDIKGSTVLLSYNNVSKTVKEVATRMGFDKSKFAAHSPRISGVSTLRACQTPESYTYQADQGADCKERDLCSEAI
eukprot:gene44846-55808_t